MPAAPGPTALPWQRALRESEAGRAIWFKAITESDSAYKNCQTSKATSAYAADRNLAGWRPVTHNKHFAIVRQWIGALVPRDVGVTAVAYDAIHQAKAPIVSANTNWTWRQWNTTALSRRLCYNAKVKGVGAWYITWDDPLLPDADPELLDLLREAHPQAERHSGRMAWAYNIDPIDFLISAQDTDLEDCGWAGHRSWYYEQTLREMAKRGAFPGLGPNDLAYAPLTNTSQWLRPELQPPFGPGYQYGKTNKKGGPPADALWEVWTLYDFRRGERHLILPGTNRILRTDQNDLGNPYVDFRPGDTGGEFFTLPEYWQYAPALGALDAVTNAEVDHASYTARSVRTVDRNAGTAADVQSLAEAPAGAIVALPKPFQESIKDLETQPIPAGLTQLKMSLFQNITELSGGSEPGTGNLSRPANTATEVDRVVQMQTKREGADRVILDKFYARVADRIHVLDKRFVKGGRAIQRLGEDGLQWEQLTVNPKDLAGAYQFLVHQGSTSEGMRAQRQSFLLNAESILIPLAQAGVVDITPALEILADALEIHPRRLIKNAAAIQQMPAGGPGVNRSPQEAGGPRAPQAPKENGAVPDTRRAQGASDDAHEFARDARR